MVRIIAALSCTLLFIFQSSQSCAQSITQDEAIPEIEGVGSLPEPGSLRDKSGAVGVVIDGVKAPFYKAIIIPELFDFVRDGSLMLDAVSRIKYAWRLDDQAQKLSTSLMPDLIDKSGAVKSNFPLLRGFVFGSNALLAEEKDPKILAKKILYNISSNWWSQKSIDISLEYSLFKNDQIVKKFRADFQRVYPSAINQNDKTGQMFREKFILKSPSFLNGFQWLSFRFRSEEEDLLWIHSKVNNKTRQLTGSNRSDNILNYPISLDDLLGWSTKLEIQDAVVLNPTQNLITLVPFPATDLLDYQQNQACSQVIGRADDADFNWNSQSKRFVGAAAWVHTGSVFVPRKVWQVEIVSRDPYASYGRQILFVDAFSMLPVYKLVYDRSGVLWKTVITSFGLYSNKDRTKKSPFPAYSIIIDHKNPMVSTVDYNSVTYCDNYNDKLALTNFDPRKLAQ